MLGFLKKRPLLFSIILLFFLYVGTIFYGIYRPLPHENLSYAGSVLPIEDPTFLTDLTFEKDGERLMEHSIFDEIERLIEEAQKFVIVDMFLFNDVYDEEDDYPPLTERLTEALLSKKQTNPNLDIVVITDPLNSMYGSYEPWHLKTLEEAGIPVIMSELAPLRDSNPLYSGAWRLFLRWFEFMPGNFFPHPNGSSGEDVKLHAYLKALNGKANHRKIVLTDQEGLISSANPHDASGYHSNVAFTFKGPILQDVLTTEQAVVAYSSEFSLPDYTYPEPTSTHHELQGQILTEGKVLDRILQMLQQTNGRDHVWIGMLYLSESDVVKELVAAAHRGVQVHLILDQNEESFGQQKAGLPNKPVAQRLVRESDGQIMIRWYHTDQEQYHPKLLFIDGQERSQVLSGSANFTRRNLRDLTLETSLYLDGQSDDPIMEDVRSYFSTIWTNEDGVYTVDFETSRTDSFWLEVLYRIQKLTKTSTY